MPLQKIFIVFSLRLSYDIYSLCKVIPYCIKEYATELVTRYLYMNRFAYVHFTELGCIIGHNVVQVTKHLCIKRFVYVHVTGLVLLP